MLFMPLPRPTVELLNKSRTDFDNENQLTEAALRQLRDAFPQNIETAHVLLKALVLNKLYSARVRDIDVEPLARHIASLQLDPILNSGAPAAVALITNCAGLKQYYSFATKFCSWHNPAAYPMYDGNMDECLWSYQQQDRFSEFERQDLGSYEKLISVVSTFRTFYELECFSFRELDKFLWRMGEWILRHKREAKSATSTRSP
jgi:hypothetical protein